MSYTPGPWKISYSSSYDDMYGEVGRIVYVSIGDKNIALGYSGMGYQPPHEDHDQIMSNARLIAAAPEQNEALKLARKFIANGIELGYITMPADDDPASKTLDIIDAALAKAEEKEAGA